MKYKKHFAVGRFALLLACLAPFVAGSAAAATFDIGGKLKFSIDETAAAARFTIPGTSMKPTEKSSFWRVTLDNGRQSEVAVFADEQSGKVSMKGGAMLIRYDSLKAKDGKTYNVALTIKVEEKDGLLTFLPTIENKDEGVRVNEIQCPVFEAAKLCGPKKDDTLYMPQATGRRLHNPWDGLKAHTTNYLANDDKEITWAVPYPRGSMAWMGIETGGNFLYVGRHDDKIRNCILVARRNAVHIKEEKLALTVSHMPVARMGETIETAPVSIGLLSGDWRQGAAKYRAWADTGFFKIVKKDKWVREMNGWQRIILRSQYGEDYYTSDDLPRLYEIGKKYGIDSLFLFGWWTEGMDMGYPEYNMTPEAKKKLRENVEKVQKMGGHVILVCNANMIDPQTEYYKNHGADVIRKDMYGNPYSGRFGYSEYSVMRRLFAYRQFHSVCYGSQECRNQLVKQGELMKEFAPHSIFYDIFGSEPHTPCFDDKHDHGARVDADWVTRRKVYDRLIELSGQSAFGTEITVDIAGAYVQYIHANDGFNPRDISGDRYFPQMFRQTFPEVIISNRGVRDESPGFDKNLKYAFMMGMIFDVEIFRCRGHLDMVPQYAKIVAELNQKRHQYREFLIDGKFSLSDSNRPARNIFCAEYESADGKKRLRILYNATGKSFTSKMYGVTLKEDEMRFDITDIKR